MAKVRTERIIMDGATDKELDFRIDVNVDASGMFTATLPVDICNKFKERNVSVKKGERRNSRYGFYSAETFSKVIALIEHDCKEYVSRTLIKEEIVIHYIIQTTCSYLMNDGNEIVPNGRWLKGKYATQKKYEWRNGTVPSHATDPKPYSISIFCEPQIKREYKYKSGTKKIEYNRLHSIRVGETIAKTLIGENLYWLSEVVCQAEPDGESVQEIEYTEPIAYFFVRFIKSICNLNESLKDFISPKEIKKLVDKQFNLLEYKNDKK